MPSKPRTHNALGRDRVSCGNTRWTKRTRDLLRVDCKRCLVFVQTKVVVKKPRAKPDEDLALVAKATLCVAIARGTGKRRLRDSTVENMAVKLMEKSGKDLAVTAKKLGIPIPRGFRKS